MTEWLFTLSNSSQARFWDTPFGELSIPEQVFVTVWGLDGEVGNGGFWQYYFNESGDHARFAPEALRAIGADEKARIVETANAVFGSDGPSVQRKLRQLALEEMGEAPYRLWRALEDRYFKMPDDFDELLAAFVLANKPEIRGDIPGR